MFDLSPHTRDRPTPGSHTGTREVRTSRGLGVSQRCDDSHASDWLLGNPGALSQMRAGCQPCQSVENVYRLTLPGVFVKFVDSLLFFPICISIQMNIIAN